MSHDLVSCVNLFIGVSPWYDLRGRLVLKTRSIQSVIFYVWMFKNIYNQKSFLNLCIISASVMLWTHWLFYKGISGNPRKNPGGGEALAIYYWYRISRSGSVETGVRSEGKLCTNIKSVLRYRTELGNTHQCDEAQGNNSTQALSTKCFFFGCKQTDRQQKKEANKRDRKELMSNKTTTKMF